MDSTKDTTTRWLTARESAAYARCGLKVVYRAIQDGHLRAARIGGRRDVRCCPEWIDAWLIASAEPIEVRRG